MFIFRNTQYSIILYFGFHVQCATLKIHFFIFDLETFVLHRLITIRYTAPVENIFWKRDAMKPIGQKIVQLMYDMNFETSPVILHVFSNGGAYLYQHLDLAMKEFQTPLDVSRPW